MDAKSDTRCTDHPTLEDVASYFDDIGKLLPRGHTSEHYAKAVRDSIGIRADLLAACEASLLGYQETFNYVPHGSKTREKMVYAIALCEAALAKAVR